MKAYPKISTKEQKYNNMWKTRQEEIHSIIEYIICKPFNYPYSLYHPSQLLVLSNFSSQELKQGFLSERNSHCDSVLTTQTQVHLTEQFLFELP